MRLEALLMTAGLALASAGTAAASPADACAGKTWLAEIVCTAKHDAAKREMAKREPPANAFSFWDALARPHTALDWFRDQLGKDTMISSRERPSTRPAATAPSDATRREDGAPEGSRSP